MGDFSLLASISLALLFPLAGASSAEGPAPQRPPLISRPAWIVPPAPRDDEYPDFASVLGLPGTVTVNCLTLTNGQLTDCRVVSAIPAEIGFEAMALDIAQRGSVRPARDASGPREARIEFRVRFSTATEFERSKPWKGPEPNTAQLEAARPVALWMLEQPDFPVLDFGLYDLQPALRSQVEAWVIELTKQPSIQDAVVLALARVMAKNGATEFPAKQPENWAEWEKDFMLALEDQEHDTSPFDQLRQKFCSIRACKPVV